MGMIPAERDGLIYCTCGQALAKHAGPPYAGILRIKHGRVGEIVTATPIAIRCECGQVWYPPRRQEWPALDWETT